MNESFALHKFWCIERWKRKTNVCTNEGEREWLTKKWKRRSEREWIVKEELGRVIKKEDQCTYKWGREGMINKEVKEKERKRVNSKGRVKESD
jgi:hypothetical protein